MKPNLLLFLSIIIVTLVNSSTSTKIHDLHSPPPTLPPPPPPPTSAPPKPTPPPSITILPNNSKIMYSGRIDQSNSTMYNFDWSGVEIGFMITGTTSISALFSTSGPTINMFNVFINFGLYTPLNVTSSTKQGYDVISDGMLDPRGTYNILLTKRTEAFIGIVSFYGFVVDPNSVILPYVPSTPTRKLEFIGDSITCGYGIDGTAPCEFSVDTEDSYQTYESIISRMLGSQLHIQSWSGKGVVKNAGSNTTASTNPFPVYYGRTIANNASSVWTFDNYIPDAVVINLGTNDYSAPPTPAPADFIKAYISFIDLIQQKYSNSTPIFLACGPMISQPCCGYVQTVAQQTDSIYIDLEDVIDPDTDIGCEGHPNTMGHLKMAAYALPIIAKNLGWVSTPSQLYESISTNTL